MTYVWYTTCLHLMYNDLSLPALLSNLCIVGKGAACPSVIIGAPQKIHGLLLETLRIDPAVPTSAGFWTAAKGLGVACLSPAHSGFLAVQHWKHFDATRLL